jgi:hypothetical protein
VRRPLAIADLVIVLVIMRHWRPPPHGRGHQRSGCGILTGKNPPGIAAGLSEWVRNIASITHQTTGCGKFTIPPRGLEPKVLDEYLKGGLGRSCRLFRWRGCNRHNPISKTCVARGPMVQSRLPPAPLCCEPGREPGVGSLTFRDHVWRGAASYATRKAAGNSPGRSAPVPSMEVTKN